MSDEVRTRKTRRRQRSRKKKAVVTIESIAPGRAPLGVCRPIPSVAIPVHHVEHRAATPSASEWPRPVSSCDSLHSSESRFSTLTPAPPLTPIRSNSAFPFQPTSKNIRIRCFSSSSLPHTPLLDSLLQSSRHSATRSDSVSKKARSLPRKLTSPLFIRDNPVTTRMAFRRSLIKPHSQTFRPQNTQAVLYQDDIYELRNLDDLPSSQAICLAKFAKAHPRNKGNKPWKPLQLESTEESDSKDRQSPMALFETDRAKPRSRLSALHRAHSGECNLNKHSEDVSTYSRFHSQLHNYNPEAQYKGEAWPTNANIIHYYENPLNYSHNYGLAYSFSHSQLHSCISESPFLRNDDYHSSEHLPWSTDMHSSFLEVLQPNHYNQNFIAEGNVMTDSSLNSYSTSFDQPGSRSPYASIPVHYDHAVTHEGILALRPSLSESHEDQSRDFSTLSWDCSLDAVQDHVLSPKPSAPAIECQPHTSALFHSQSSNEVDALQMPRADTPGPDLEISYRDDQGHSKKEHFALFRRAIYEQIGADRDKFSTPQMETHDGHAQGTPATDSSHKRVSDLNGESATTDSIKSESVEIRGNFQLEMTEKPLRLDPIWYDFTERWKGFPATGFPGHLNLITSKRVRPPPGLSEPVVPNPTTWPLLYRNDPLVTQKRLDDANEWFHTDARGQGQLRGQVTDIAQSYAGNIKRLSGATRALQESIAAKQLNSLLGNVIVNLHFYVSDSSARDAAGFANFKDVDSYYCEPDLSGRRSYFDQDPSVHYQRLHLGRVYSTISNMSESGPSSHTTAP
ncbi:hypothetical protein BDV26DRAFT_302699 [Aspergillus bertholletiae]|uniref:Uncharacterized protein n=1 Tax=Aspergillus bertholletiae TaxID=1226010 RepID=A0A5N7ANR1_9EURO|nr:hypothetical protein BDV26DRAFT_302699 [Aspergillus bertholletiae]